MFGFLRNLLALVGLVAVVAGGVGYMKVQGLLASLDPEAPKVFAEIGKTHAENLDYPGVAVVKTVPVKEGMKAEDVVDSLKSLAVQHGMLFVGESPFYKQVEAMTGKPYRFVSFFSFCDAMVGAQMIEYNTAYSAFMPCRIALVEDTKGRLWLHMMSLDLMISGGKPLPKELKAGAVSVRDRLNKILEGAAKGEF
jgi:uncharacterized protein (DUF302 family)